MQGVFPLANILTQNVEVAPDSSFNASINFAYHNKNITLDVGYSCYARSAEKVSLKQTWTNDTYAPAAVGYAPADAFEIISPYHTTTTTLVTNVYPYQYGSSGENLALMSEGLAINRGNLDTDTASTPAILTNTIYFGFSALMPNFEYPVIFGAGMSYEWGSDNASLDAWNGWVKLGITF